MNNSIDVKQLGKSSQRYAVASFIGICIVIVSIAYSSYTLYNLKNEVDQKRNELAQINEEKQELELKVNDLEERLKQTVKFDRNRYQIDWSSSKALASNWRTARLVDDIFTMRYNNVSWKLGGTSPESGFDSPSFAAYLLIKKYGLLDVEFDDRYRLRELIPETNEPETGDLIFYDTGYTMFYFKDRRGNPFCIGMTPMGIVALQIDFGPRLLGFGKINY